MTGVSHHESEAQSFTTHGLQQERSSRRCAVKGGEGQAFETVDRYRAAFDAADGAGEEEPPRYAEVAALLVHEFVRLGLVVWAAMNPLRPLSPEIFVEADDSGTEELHNLLPELRRFGEASFTRGDPARLGEMSGRSGREREREERELFKESMRRAADEDQVEDARRWARMFEGRLRLLGPDERRDVLAELHDALAR